MTGMPTGASQFVPQHSAAGSAKAMPNDSAEAKRSEGSVAKPRITTSAMGAGRLGAIFDSGVGCSNACRNRVTMLSSAGGNGNTPDNS